MHRHALVPEPVVTFLCLTLLTAAPLRSARSSDTCPRHGFACTGTTCVLNQGPVEGSHARSFSRARSSSLRQAESMSHALLTVLVRFAPRARPEDSPVGGSIVSTPPFKTLSRRHSSLQTLTDTLVRLRLTAVKSCFRGSMPYGHSASCGPAPLLLRRLSRALKRRAGCGAAEGWSSTELEFGLLNIWFFTVILNSCRYLRGFGAPFLQT